MYVGVFPTYMSVHHMHAVAVEARRRCSRQFKLSHGCWEYSSGPLEQPVPLMPGPSLQPPPHFNFE